jgi:hypothetical protein
MEEIPSNRIVRLSMLMDRNMALRGARLVVDTISLGKALLHVQHAFKRLLGAENIVSLGFKAPNPCAYPAGFIVGWVRLSHWRRAEHGPADNLGWNVLQLVHITKLHARHCGFTQWLEHLSSFGNKSLVCCNIAIDEAYLPQFLLRVLVGIYRHPYCKTHMPISVLLMQLLSDFSASNSCFTHQ